MRKKKKRTNSCTKDIVQKAPSLCRDLESEGLKSLQREQQRWKAEEKAQLHTKAKHKSLEMKSQASKALEPELRKLVEKHTIEREKLREEIESNLQSSQARVNLEFETKLQRGMRNIDREEEAALLELDKHYKGKLSELTTQLQHEKRSIEENSKKEKEGLRLSLQMKLDEEKRDCRRSLSNWEKECAKEIKTDRQVVEARLKHVENENNRNVDDLSRRLESNWEAWKVEEELNLKQSFDNFLSREEKGARAKCESEITMVKEKMVGSLNEKKMTMENQLHSELQVSLALFYCGRNGRIILLVSC